MKRLCARSVLLARRAAMPLLLALSGLAHSTHLFASPPDTLPDGFVAQQVAEASEIDGKRVALWSIRSAGTPRGAIALIESRWRQQDQGAPLVRTERAGWILLSRQRLDALETVQIRSQGAVAEGYLSRWGVESFANEPRRLASNWLPRFVSAGPELVSHEGGVRVRTMVGSSQESPAHILDAVAQIAMREGLQRVDSSRTTVASTATPHASLRAEVANHSALARFAGRGRDLFVTIDHNPDAALTFVVAHLTETVR